MKISSNDIDDVHYLHCKSVDICVHLVIVIDIEPIAIPCISPTKALQVSFIFYSMKTAYVLHIRDTSAPKEDISSSSKDDYDSSIISHHLLSLLPHFLRKMIESGISRIAQPTHWIRPNQATQTLAVISDARSVSWFHSAFNIYCVQQVVRRRAVRDKLWNEVGLSYKKWQVEPFTLVPIHADHAWNSHIVMDIFYASGWYNFYVFTVVPRDFYASASWLYASAWTAPNRYHAGHFFRAVHRRQPDPKVFRKRKKREKKKRKERTKKSKQTLTKNKATMT